MTNLRNFPTTATFLGEQASKLLCENWRDKAKKNWVDFDVCWLGLSAMMVNTCWMCIIFSYVVLKKKWKWERTRWTTAEKRANEKIKIVFFSCSFVPSSIIFQPSSWLLLLLAWASIASLPSFSLQNLPKPPNVEERNSKNSWVFFFYSYTRHSPHLGNEWVWWWCRWSLRAERTTTIHSTWTHCC